MERWITVIAAIITGLGSGFGGAVMASLLNRKELDLKKAQYELEQKHKQVEIDRTYNYRFGDAVARLQSDSLGVRMGALYELEKLSQRSKEDAKITVIVIRTFSQEHIGEQQYWNLPNKDILEQKEWLPWPKDDIKLAGTILSRIYKTWEIRAHFNWLNAQKLHFRYFKFEGAYLFESCFYGAKLQRTSFKNAIMRRTNFQNATIRIVCFDNADLGEADFKDTEFISVDLVGADLRGAKNLTVEQLRHAQIDETTQLDPHLANDPRIQARIAELTEQE